MLENCESAKERWGGVSEIIDRWLQERQDLLVQYCTLSENKSFDEKDQNQTDLVRRMCQIMMDYLSAGHFEVYEQLAREGKEFYDTEALEEAKTLYQQAEGTTDPLLDFNDKYQETDDLSTLQKDLSHVGELLANRFEAEDKMIAVLHMAHKDLVA